MGFSLAPASEENWKVSAVCHSRLSKLSVPSLPPQGCFSIQQTPCEPWQRAPRTQTLPLLPLTSAEPVWLMAVPRHTPPRSLSTLSLPDEHPVPNTAMRACVRPSPTSSWQVWSHHGGTEPTLQQAGNGCAATCFTVTPCGHIH